MRRHVEGNHGGAKKMCVPEFDADLYYAREGWDLFTTNPAKAEHYLVREAFTVKPSPFGHPKIVDAELNSPMHIAFRRGIYIAKRGEPRP